MVKICVEKSCFLKLHCRLAKKLFLNSKSLRPKDVMAAIQALCSLYTWQPLAKTNSRSQEKHKREVEILKESFRKFLFSIDYKYYWAFVKKEAEKTGVLTKAKRYGNIFRYD